MPEKPTAADVRPQVYSRGCFYGRHHDCDDPFCDCPCHQPGDRL